MMQLEPSDGKVHAPDVSLSTTVPNQRTCAVRAKFFENAYSNPAKALAEKPYFLSASRRRCKTRQPPTLHSFANLQRGDSKYCFGIVNNGYRRSSTTL